MSSETIHESINSPLQRVTEGRLLGGVGVGIAEKFDVDVTYVRLAMIALALCGPGVPLYVAAWLLIPDAGTETAIASGLAHFIRHSS